MSIIILTEASISLGLGHVHRMLVLADAILAHSDIIFVTKSAERLRQIIAQRGFRVLDASQGYECVLEDVSKVDAVVVDFLHVPESLILMIRRVFPATRVVVFGNVSKANMLADAVINAIIGTDFTNRRRRALGAETLYLEGPAYVMLAEAYRSRRNAWHPSGGLRKVLLLFGGSDQANLTCKVARILLEKNPALAITACAGPLYPHMQELESAAAEMVDMGADLTIVSNSQRVHELMLDSDCTVTSPGNSLFELFCLGVPAIAFFQTLGQAEMFRGFPMCYEIAELDSVWELMQSVMRDYERYRECVDALDVGSGFNEICQTILSNEPINS